jgi:hypothetical protein
MGVFVIEWKLIAATATSYQPVCGTEWRDCINQLRKGGFTCQNLVSALGSEVHVDVSVFFAAHRRVEDFSKGFEVLLAPRLVVRKDKDAAVSDGGFNVRYRVVVLLRGGK